MLCFNFAGIYIELQTENISDYTKLTPFISRYDGEPDIRVTFTGSDSVERPIGRLVLTEFVENDIRLGIIESDNENISFFLEQYSTSAVISRLDTDKSWTHTNIIYSKKEAIYEHYALWSLGSLLLKNKVIMFNGLAVHASAVVDNNRGVIFSAPSGTGKSTHAKLWEKYRGARIINDDNPVLRSIDGKTYVFGTPWSGSSDRFDNSLAELKAIVLLEQAKENKIVKLGAAETVQRFMPRCYLPYHDRKLLDAAMNNLETIIAMTPVYLLGCTPEKEAMELVYQCIF